MFQPLIGIWWYTDDKDLLGLRQSVDAGIRLGIWRSPTMIHESAWEKAIPHNSKYYGADPSNFATGYVIFNSAISQYYILCDQEESLHDEDLHRLIIDEFHLDSRFVHIEKHHDLVEELRVFDSNHSDTDEG